MVRVFVDRWERSLQCYDSLLGLMYAVGRHCSVISEITEEFQVCCEESESIIYLRALRQTTLFAAFILMLFSVQLLVQTPV